MGELTNVTDRIAHLRDRKSIQDQAAKTPRSPKKPKQVLKPGNERRFATDTFMIFVYALLAVALVSQVALILSLDVLIK